ncbi:MAG: proton-conducting transporter membrane subunit [Dehalococcoidia bacterium]|nr:proton-conducting transporter membrane subunit [Dehalococcoidia bacterium]
MYEASDRCPGSASPWIGAITALVAATIALVQTDFKRVLAYSTISQLGYMILALGVFGYVAAIFHLFTHAFFKALLFLGSGSVNHSTNTFDMRKMGGLRTTMPITFWTFLIGSLSLSGIFPLAGFWSKDEILKDAWLENQALWAIGFVVAFLTALYMFRAIFLTFFGTYRGGEPVDHEDEDSHFHGDPAHPHESGWVMTIPLILLAIPAVVAGVFNMTGITDGFGKLITGALPEAEHHALSFDWGIALSSTAVALLGIATAWAIYYRRVVYARRRSATPSIPSRVIFENKYFLDRLYEDFLVKTVLQRGWNRLCELVDVYIVDGIGTTAPALSPRAPAHRLRASRPARSRPMALASRSASSSFRGRRHGQSIVGGPRWNCRHPLSARRCGRSHRTCCCPQRQEQHARWLALAGSLAAFVISLVVFFQFDPDQAGYQFVERHQWVDIGSFNLQYFLGVDGLEPAVGRR